MLHHAGADLDGVRPSRMKLRRVLAGLDAAERRERSAGELAPIMLRDLHGHAQRDRPDRL